MENMKIMHTNICLATSKVSGPLPPSTSPAHALAQPATPPLSTAPPVEPPDLGQVSYKLFFHMKRAGEHA